MKNLKRYIAMLLAVMLVLGLAACGGSGNGSAAPPQSAEEVSVEETVTVDASEDEVADTVEETVSAEEEVAMEELSDGLVPVELPLTEEEETFSIFFSQPDFFNAFLEDPADNPCFQELAKRTNVSLDFMVISMEAQADRFQVLAASGSLPDFVMNGSSMYAGGGTKAIEDEVFVNLAEYEEFMPNYFHYVNLDKEWKALLSTENGTVVDAVYAINSPSSVGGSGLLIRGDWLEELDLDMPQSYDEYYDVLTAFKNEKGCAAPLQINAGLSNQLWAMGFGANAAIGDHDNNYDWFGTIGDEVVFWPATENYREYLETMQKWYAEGLLDSDWISRTGGNKADTTLIGNGDTGLWFSTLSDIASFDVQDPNASIVSAPTPGRDANYTGFMMPAAMSRDRTCLSVTTNCENVELAAQYIDYIFSEEGQLLSNYGVEGVTFEYDAEGNPQFTEFVTNSDTGFDASLTMVLYGLGNFPGAFNPTRYYGELQLETLEQWTGYKAHASETNINGFSSAMDLSGEAAVDAAEIMSDVMTMVREATSKVMCNQATLEEYDATIAALDDMGIASVVEAYQAAYDDYIAG